MRGLLAAIAAAAALAGGSACAMSAGETSSPCRVIGGEKLSPDSGGADAICQAIATAAAERAPGIAYNIEVKVLDNSRLSATIKAGGRELPAQNFVRMDRPLSRQAFDRFATTVAEELAKAGTANS